MPFSGQSPFLRVRLPGGLLSGNHVSMPFSGQSPFLRITQKIQRNVGRLCQCPSAGNPHFYFAGGYALAGGFNKDVSMPFSGQSPFLPGGKEGADEQCICVNALQRAIPISTAQKGETTWQMQECVNALQRAIPISTKT